MYKHNGFNLKKLLSALACFILIVAMTFSVACNDGDDSSSSSSSSSSAAATVTATDYQTLKNGDFEFGTSKKADKDYPVSSGINWTKSYDNSLAVSAPTTSKTSGIINTEDEAYKVVADKQGFPKDSDGTYFNPHTPEYYGLVADADKYIYNEDTAKDNPNADGLVTSGSKILMINNNVKTTGEDRGTAQKFTSSTTLSTSTGYGKLSVWVLTKDLSTFQNTNDFGAYISVINTLSSTRSPFIVKNINTNGNWVQYNVYVEASDYASSSFKVVLGLGFGSKTVMDELVKGYAYFDNVHFEELEKADYLAATSGVTEYSIFDNGTDNDAANLIVSHTGVASTANGEKSDAFSQANFDATTKHDFVLSHRIDNASFTPAIDTAASKKNDVLLSGAEHGTDADADVKAFDQIAAANGIENPVAADAQTLYINLASKSSYTVTTDKFDLAAGTYAHVSFSAYVDIEAPKGVGAKIEIEEVDASGNVLGTASAVASDIDTYSADENASVWKDVSIFVGNDTDKDRHFRIKFTLGTTENVEYFEELTKGIALFTGFEGKMLSENEYGIVSSSDDYKATFALGNEFLNGAEDEDESSDSYVFTPTTAYKPSFDSSIAKAITGYTGVVGGHTMVGGENSAYNHANTVAGLINTGKTYADADLAALASKLNGLSPIGENDHVQPIIINNSTGATSYGFLGSSLSLAANSTTQISVRVKAFDAAKAYVYLVNAEALSNYDVLTVAVDGEDAQPLMAEITASSLSNASNGWVEVNFVITTGDEAISYRVELWNGKRDGSEASIGMVAFDNLINTTSVNLNTLKAQLSAYGTADGDIVEKSHTRAPSTVTSTDEETGEDVTTTRTYGAQVNYIKYVKANSIIASYATIHAPAEIDETTDTSDDSASDSSSEEVADPTGNNWALQLTSIIIAAVLVAVLAFVLIRMLVKKNKKAQLSTTSYYSRDSREVNQERIRANKAKRAAAEKRKAEELAEAEAAASIPVEEEAVEEAIEETEEVAEEYDYDNPENNVASDDEPKGE